MSIFQTQSLLLKMKLSLLNLNKESSLEEVNKSLSYHYLDHYTSDLSSGLTNNYAQLSVLFPLYYTALGLVDGAKKVEEDGQGEAEDKSKEVAKSGTPSNSSQPFEPVIYLLANKICAGVDIYQDSRLLPSSATIPELLILLESALIRNVHDFYSKLLLIRLYNSLGATSASHALYESLDVKLIQNDTLGHFFLNPFLSTGVFSHAQEFLFASWKFYSYNFKEVLFCFGCFIFNCVLTLLFPFCRLLILLSTSTSMVHLPRLKRFWHSMTSFVIRFSIAFPLLSATL